MVDAADSMIALLRETFAYDPETGAITSKVTGRRLKVTTGQYGSVSLAGKRYPAHRAIWAMVHGEWPPAQIDHINREPSDNRLANLRTATKAQNRANTPGWSPSGVKGVYFQPIARTYRSWVAKITPPGGKSKMLGRYATRDEAAAAYSAAATECFGEFHCGEHRDGIARNVD